MTGVHLRSFVYIGRRTMLHLHRAAQYVCAVGLQLRIAGCSEALGRCGMVKKSRERVFMTGQVGLPREHQEHFDLLHTRCMITTQVPKLLSEVLKSPAFA